MKEHIIVPEERTETIIQELLKLLEGRDIAIGELSKKIGRSEKELNGYLEQLLRIGKLKIVPAECGKCGFVFETRNKIKKPGKCPKCKGTYIEQPLFSAKPK